MYYLFISKGKYITAYIGKKINKDIAKYIIKFANINGSYQIKDCRGLINLNSVSTYKLSNNEIICNFIENIKNISRIESIFLVKINYYIYNVTSCEIINPYEVRSLNRYITYNIKDGQHCGRLVDFKNNNFIDFLYKDKFSQIYKTKDLFDYKKLASINQFIILNEDNTCFDFIPNDFFQKKQILIDFMKYLILLSLNEFNIEYFDEEFYPI